MKIRIEPLQIKDAHLIPKLIGSGMKKDIFPLTIFSSNGYEVYIKNLLTLPEKNRRVKLYGAFVDDRLAGYTEWRVFEEGLFLNNIYVFPEYQRFGIGKSLLVKHGNRLLDEYGKHKMSLDVFDHNEEAISWYEKIGFVRNDSTYWYIGEQPALARSNCTYDCYIENYPNAKAEHEAYEFSMFTCSTKNGVYQIGKLNNQFYRLTDSNALYDHDLLNCLLQLDSKRKLLLLTGEVFSSHPEFTLACKSNRMIL